MERFAYACRTLGSMLILGFESIDGRRDERANERTDRQTDQFSDRCKIHRHSTIRIAFVITYREATFATGIVTHYSGLTPSCTDYHNHCAYHFQSISTISTNRIFRFSNE